MDLDPTTTKYEITAEMTAEGVVEKPDVIGAIFGQTEGLLGEELDLRDLQKSGRIGRIEVEANSEGGKTTGKITLPSSLDKVETAILAAALESIDRIGPCKATVEVETIEDVRVSKRDQVMGRAKELLQKMSTETKDASGELIEEVKESVRIEELVSYGSERLPAGPTVSSSDAILVVEGRNDVANLLRNGIKNAIAVEGTSIPQTVKDLAKEKVITALVDGDRGGELLLKELIQVADVDFVAQAPANHEVEELTQKQLMKTLRNKVPLEQWLEDAEIEAKEDKATSSQGQGQSSSGRQRQEPKDRSQKDRSQKDRSQKDRSEKRDRKDKGRRRDKQQTQKPKSQTESKPSRQADQASSPLQAYQSHLGNLSGQLQGVLLDDKDNVIKGPLPVRDLADTLKKEGQGAKAVVFDGVITQRLLDIAVEKGISTLVGVKKGNITNEPGQIEVLTSDDL